MKQLWKDIRNNPRRLVVVLLVLPVGAVAILAGFLLIYLGRVVGSPIGLRVKIGSFEDRDPNSPLERIMTWVEEGDHDKLEVPRG